VPSHQQRITSQHRAWLEAGAPMTIADPRAEMVAVERFDREHS
jgi:hypothetical protein